MDETAKMDGVQDQQEVRDQVVEERSKESSQPALSYDTYKRTVGEVKKVKSQNAELMERLKTYEQRDLEAQGKHADLIQALRQENQKLKQDVEERDQVYTWSRRSEGLKSELSKHGCRNSDHLLRLMDESVLNEIEVDDNYVPIKEDVARVVETYKGNPDYQYLFKSVTHSVDTVNPQAKIEKKQPASLKEIPLRERIAMLGLDKKEVEK